MFAGKTHNLPRISNFAAAAKYFEATKRPPRSTKWSEDERPLRDARSYHYRIVQGLDGAYYDLCLYQTVMARYWQPDAQGHERRQYIGNGSQTSRNFMWDVLGIGRASSTIDTNGRRVLLPVTCAAMEQSKFSVDAFFTADDALVIERSKHTPIFKVVSHDSDKLSRAHAKKLFEPVLTLAAMRMPELIHDVDISANFAGPFRTCYKLHIPNDILRLYNALQENTEPAPEQLDALFTAAQAVLNKLASDAALKAGLLRYWANRPTYSEIEPITEAQLIKSLWNKLLQDLGLADKRGKEYYPQFPEYCDVVHRNIHV